MFERCGCFAYAGERAQGRRLLVGAAAKRGTQQCEIARIVKIVPQGRPTSHLSDAEKDNSD